MPHEFIRLELTREELEDLAAQVDDGHWLTPGHQRQLTLLAKLNAALGRAAEAQAADPAEQVKQGY